MSFSPDDQPLLEDDAGRQPEGRMEPALVFPDGDGQVATQLPPPSPPPAVVAVAEDLRTPWGWRGLLLFLVAAMGIAVVISFPLLAILGRFGIKQEAVFHASYEQSVFLVVNQAVWSLAIMLYLCVITRAVYHAPFWESMGWRRLHKGGISSGRLYAACAGGGAVLALLVSFASSGISRKGPLPIEAIFQDRQTALLLMLMSVLIAPWVEETIFRGLLYPVVARQWGMASGVLLTGVAFGAVHASQLWGGWWQIGLLVVVGIVLTWVRAVSGTVFASFVMHFCYNGFLFAGFIASGGLQHLPRH